MNSERNIIMKLFESKVKEEELDEKTYTVGDTQYYRWKGQTYKWTSANGKSECSEDEYNKAVAACSGGASKDTSSPTPDKKVSNSDKYEISDAEFEEYKKYRLPYSEEKKITNSIEHDDSMSYEEKYARNNSIVDALNAKNTRPGYEKVLDSDRTKQDCINSIKKYIDTCDDEKYIKSCKASLKAISKMKTCDDALKDASEEEIERHKKYKEMSVRNTSSKDSIEAYTDAIGEFCSRFEKESVNTVSALDYYNMNHLYSVVMDHHMDNRISKTNINKLNTTAVKILKNAHVPSPIVKKFGFIIDEKNW